ncbi:MAG: YggT family protein [Simkania sp.]|nr:YggT family protein [Simkania sp.]
MYYVISAIRLFFLVYTLMILIRVLGSWFPNFQRTRFMQFIAHYTDPYINIFRRFIPPIGGVLDLSPLIAFFVLKLVEKFLMMLILYAVR